MGRATKDARLDTRAARDRLPKQHEPYWRAIGAGLFLGYRKGDRGGRWIVRRYADGRYHKEVLGEADDYRDANNVDVFSYYEASEKARTWADAHAKATKAGAVRPDYTIGDALDDYLRWYAAHRKAIEATRFALERHIRPALGAVRVADLTAREIRRWHEGLIERPAAKPTDDGKPASLPPDPDARRRRKATANRVLTILKAALNHAFRDGVALDDGAWRRVKPFAGVDLPRVRYLTEAECIRLQNVCPPDFRDLVRAALLTGARFGELRALRCHDFNPDAGTLGIATTKTGAPRHVPLTDEGRKLFTRLTAGRGGSDWMLTHTDGRPWGKSHQSRPMREACEAAKIDPPIGFHILRHSFGSLLAQKNVPLLVLADLLGHADTRMTKRHYAHLNETVKAEAVRAHLPAFGEDEQTNVVALTPRKAAP